LVRYRQKELRFCDLVRDVNERIIANACFQPIRVWKHALAVGLIRESTNNQGTELRTGYSETS
jgi:hypothetical protein